MANRRSRRCVHWEEARVSDMPLVTKPESGHWTDAYPELGRGPVSFDDCVSADFYEKEREHIFCKTWFYVGRVEQASTSGSYFTSEIKLERKRPRLNTRT